MARTRRRSSKVKSCGHRNSRAGKGGQGKVTPAKSRTPTWPRNSVPWMQEK